MFQRIFAIIQKEFAQALRDRPTMAIMLSMPLLLLILFGYAITTQVRHIPTAVADQSLDAYSRAYLEDMVNSQYFDLVQIVPDPASVRQEMDAGRARAGIVIPPDFAEHIQRGDAQVLVMVDGSDLFTSQAAYSAANLVGQNHAARIVMQNIADSGSAADTQSLPSLLAHIRILYNPDLIDLWFIIPGIAAMLLQTQTIVLTAAAVVREREVGTIEQILVTPIRPLELMLGKIVPYLCVAIFNILTRDRPGGLPVQSALPGRYLAVPRPVPAVCLQRVGPGAVDFHHLAQPARGAAVDHADHDHRASFWAGSSSRATPCPDVIQAAGQPVSADLLYPDLARDHHPRGGLLR